jgi:hypothetical protein
VGSQPGIMSEKWTEIRMATLLPGVRNIATSDAAATDDARALFSESDSIPLALRLY